MKRYYGDEALAMMKKGTKTVKTTITTDPWWGEKKVEEVTYLVDGVEYTYTTDRDGWATLTEA